MRRTPRSLEKENDYASLYSRLRREHEERRREDREREERILKERASSNAVDGFSRNRGRGPLPSEAAGAGKKKPLKIEKVHWYISDNAKKHHTDKFELAERGTPIFRRGQTFFILLTFGEGPERRAFDETTDNISLIFSFGLHSSTVQQTQHILKVNKTAFKDDIRWAAKLYGHDENGITVQVRTGPDACVGIWRCSVSSGLMGVRRGRGPRPLILQCPEDIYLLFNPWEPLDTTYMHEKELLEEYILNDKGKIWRGSYGQAYGRPWNFGQFDDSILPCAMIMLEKSITRASCRGNPILVSRALSKMVNQNDDDGVLHGRWDGNYEDGKAPSSWTGSLAIIEKYFESMSETGKPVPVKYGQCWVFSGVLATFCRALGIPCRVVTNMESAHDANETLTIDYYYDENNKPLKFDPFNAAESNDSVWNFHVWNDVWMARPDLQSEESRGYGGWQAIDSTPQETSDGVFQCGPASLEAIRRGQIGLAYDVPFLLAEVNADIVHWKRDQDSKRGWRRMTADKFKVGRMILTKKPNVFDPYGDGDRDDILSEYKSKEGSRAERLALYNAVNGKPNIASFYGRLGKEKPGDVNFVLNDLDKVNVGDTFSVIVSIENTSDELRTIEVSLSVASIYYTGIRAKEIKTGTAKYVVQSGGKEQLKMKVPPEEYMKKLVEYGAMKIFAICAVIETTQAWCAEDDFQVIKPCLKLQVEPELKVGVPSTIKMSFKNPLRRTLTACFINYEGPCYTRTKTVPQENVEPLTEFSYEYEFVPKNLGSQRIVITFTSVELSDIIGMAMVEIL